MERLVLDGRSLDSMDQVHRMLKEELKLPDYYGANLDALWDCLTGFVSLPLTIQWIHIEDSERRLGDDGRALVKLFEEAQEELDGFRFETELS
ncbi:barstar family protein [Paenibacillus sp. NPDC058071]|uniref:barstar family protein n=1 Tax=Paenibacillus sp. NPDC058071 TaxID=3346326 RepID=UPI0036DE88E8